VTMLAESYIFGLYGYRLDDARRQEHTSLLKTSREARIQATSVFYGLLNGASQQVQVLVCHQVHQDLQVSYHSSRSRVPDSPQYQVAQTSSRRPLKLREYPIVISLHGHSSPLNNFLHLLSSNIILSSSPGIYDTTFSHSTSLGSKSQILIP